MEARISVQYMKRQSGVRASDLNFCLQLEVLGNQPLLSRRPLCKIGRPLWVKGDVFVYHQSENEEHVMLSNNVTQG